MAESGSRSINGAQYEANNQQSGPLKRAISPLMLMFFVVGDILGAGIYARVGGVAGEVGGAIWVSFLVAMVLAGLTALSYVELVTRFPGAAGAALYVHKAYKRQFLTFMIAFAVLASGIASAGAVARTFSGDYLTTLLGRDVPAVPVSIGFVLVLVLINLRGVSESVKVNIGLTLLELSGLLFIIAIGVIVLLQGNGEPGRAFSFSEDRNVAIATLGGAAVAFYAMIGFEDAVNMAEETDDPVRAFPRALLLGILLAGVVYLAVAFTASMVVDTQTLANSTGPLKEVVAAGPIDVGERYFSAIALIAVTNTALINLIMAARVIYGMARQGVIPSVMGKTTPKTQTPIVAIGFTALIAIVLVTYGNLASLSNTTVALLLLVFILVNVTVLVLRRSPSSHKHFTTPTPLPILAAVSCAVLLAQLLYDDIQEDNEILVFAGGLLVLGAVLWMINRSACSRFGSSVASDPSMEAAVTGD